MGDDPNDLPGYRASVARFGEDAVHDAIAQGAQPGGAAGLFLAARRAYLDQRRKAQRRQGLAPTVPYEPDVAEGAEGALTPFDAAARNESWGRLLDALGDLDADERDALWWHFEGHGDAAILARLAARGVSLSPDGLRKRRQRTLDALRGRLRP